MAGQDSALVLSLPSEPASVPAARRAVAERLRAWGDEGLVDAVSLAVSELATNSVLHASGGFRVTLTRVREGARLEVRDDSDRMPRQRKPSALSGTGRGLQLVDTLALDWGVTAESATGKVVWAVFGEDAEQTSRGRLADH